MGFGYINSSVIHVCQGKKLTVSLYYIKECCNDLIYISINTDKAMLKEKVHIRKHFVPLF